MEAWMVVLILGQCVAYVCICALGFMYHTCLGVSTKQTNKFTFASKQGGVFPLGM
jgi:hypothetical protein